MRNMQVMKEKRNSERDDGGGIRRSATPILVSFFGYVLGE